MNTNNFNVINVGMLVVGAVLIVSGFQGKTPLEIFKEATAKARK